MYKYVLKRLLLIIPVVLFVLFVVYTIMALTPGDPGRMILGVKADQALVDQLNHELGVDQPFFTRFCWPPFQSALHPLSVLFLASSRL